VRHAHHDPHLEAAESKGTEVMLRNVSREQLVGLWVATLIVMMAMSIVAGVNLTVSGALLWLIGGVVPPGVMLLLWHAAPPLTVRQMLNSTDRASNGGRV
jgi:hypothetical protein